MLEKGAVPIPPGLFGQPKGAIVLHGRHEKPIDDVVWFLAFQNVFEKKPRQHSWAKVLPRQVVIIFQRLRDRVEPNLAVTPQLIACVGCELAILQLDPACYRLDEGSPGRRLVTGLCMKKGYDQSSGVRRTKEAAAARIIQGNSLIPGHRKYPDTDATAHRQHLELFF